MRSKVKIHAFLPSLLPLASCLFALCFFCFFSLADGLNGDRKSLTRLFNFAIFPFLLHTRLLMILSAFVILFGDVTMRYATKLGPKCDAMMMHGLPVQTSAESVEGGENGGKKRQGATNKGGYVIGERAERREEMRF
jgi:hypothetical protein